MSLREAVNRHHRSGGIERAPCPAELGSCQPVDPASRQYAFPKYWSVAHGGVLTCGIVFLKLHILEARGARRDSQAQKLHKCLEAPKQGMPVRLRLARFGRKVGRVA